MTPPRIIVTGFGRCGSTMAMAMLKAGGVPTLVESAPFEDPRAAEDGKGFAALWLDCAGKAVKVLDLHRLQRLPGPCRVIHMVRRPDHQARSMADFRAHILGQPSNREARRKIQQSLLADRPAMRKALSGQPVLVLGFEAVLRNPQGAAHEIAAFIGSDFPGFSEGRAASAVHRRPAECQGVLAEIQQMFGVAAA